MWLNKFKDNCVVCNKPVWLLYFKLVCKDCLLNLEKESEMNQEVKNLLVDEIMRRTNNLKQLTNQKQCDLFSEQIKYINNYLETINDFHSSHGYNISHQMINSTKALLELIIGKNLNITIKNGYFEKIKEYSSDFKLTEDCKFACMIDKQSSNLYLIREKIYSEPLNCRVDVLIDKYGNMHVVMKSSELKPVGDKKLIHRFLDEFNDNNEVEVKLDLNKMFRSFC
jgi:hypothetical protein